MQRVISVVRTTLTDLQLAIDGTIIMNEVSFCFGTAQKFLRGIVLCTSVFTVSDAMHA